jgi:AraC-like DNA-binding protein
LSISKIKVEESTAIFANILEQMTSELNCLKDSYQPDILRNHLQNFLLQSERERRKQDFVELKSDANLTYVLKFKELLEANFIQHKQVSFYCDKMHLTPKRLNVATSKVLDITPKDIITERILLEAKRLLVHTNNRSKEISFSLGFEEPTNFIKFFKKHLQKTPLQFREDFV